MKVIVGLGNPGDRYEGTRHNIGFEVIDYLAAAPGVSTFRSRFDGLLAETTEAGEQVLLVKPETFMNLSGRCVRRIVDFFKLPITDLLVICDDIALPLGRLRARAAGSHGGQNGLRNIQDELGSQAYSRLRIGVGSPPNGVDAADHVLARFKPGERSKVDEAIASAAAGVLVWVREGIAACMNRVNSDPDAERVRQEQREKKARDRAEQAGRPPQTDNPS